jgi:hypothetical protein
MSYDDDDDDDFFSSADDDDELPEAQRTLGLVVGPRALTPEENNGVDELVEREAEYRKNGRPPVIFEEGSL